MVCSRSGNNKTYHRKTGHHNHHTDLRSFYPRRKFVQAVSGTRVLIYKSKRTPIMKHFLVTCLCGLLAWNAMPVAAQGQNNNWVFGHGNGLRFNTNPPAFVQTSNYSIESSAAVSDAAGNLLFYSNGRTVWTANGNAMPNGTGLQGNGPATTTVFGITGSSSQGVAILKSLANPDQYYLFTLDAGEDITPAYTGYLRYSIVDMSLNGGLGDVVAGQKDIVLDEHMSELMTVVKGAGCYYWVICHRSNSATYRAFKLDATGLQPAVSSMVGSSVGEGGIQLKVSFAGDRILYQSGTGFGVEIGRFNNATGVVSDIITVDHGQQFMGYGTCFSPDDSKIYLSGLNGILQYDMAAYPNATAIAASKQTISTQYLSQMRNGPDGKIYVAAWSHPFIGTINQPDLAGAACAFDPNALPQPAWADFGVLAGPIFGHGLGTDVPIVPTEAGTTHTSDTLICQADTFRVQAPQGFQEFHWNDGSGNSFRDIHSSGVVWVKSNNGCQQRTDTFHIKLVDFGASLGPDTFLCTGGEMTFDVNTEDGTYAWQDGSHDPSLTINKAGTYTVSVTKENCTRTDTVTVSSLQPFLRLMSDDSVLCLGETMHITAITNLTNAYQWSTGATTDAIMVDQGGQYRVTVNGVCGTLTAAVEIASKRCDCTAFVPNAFSPNQDGLNDIFNVDIFCNPVNYKLCIYNRFGQRIFTSTHPGTGWDGSFQSTPADVGVYFYSLSYSNAKGDLLEQKGEVTLLR